VDGVLVGAGSLQPLLRSPPLAPTHVLVCPQPSHNWFAAHGALEEGVHLNGWCTSGCVLMVRNGLCTPTSNAREWARVCNKIFLKIIFF